jgi:hypothetical protein
MLKSGRGEFEVENPQALDLQMAPQDFLPRKEEKEKRKFVVSPLLPLLLFSSSKRGCRVRN